MLRFKIALLAAAMCCGLIVVPSLEAQPTTILAFGDSITRGFGDGSVGCQGLTGGYPPRLRGQLSNRGLQSSMRNFGRCAELTSQGLSRIDRVLASHPEAKLILLMEGTNDLSNPGISTESMFFNLRSMVEKSLAADVRPVLASPTPRGPGGGSNGRTGFLASLLASYAAESDLDFADPYNDLLSVNDVFNRFYVDSLHLNPQGYSALADSFLEPTLAAANRPVVVIPCEPNDQRLCLNSERFEIEVSWEDFEGNTGVGQAVSLTPDTGYFWFFDPANVELVLKVLDGQAFNERFWVFYGALSTVKYTITVRDSMTGRRRVYINDLNNLASVGDTAAFPGDNPENNGGNLVIAQADFESAQSVAAGAAPLAPESYTAMTPVRVNTVAAMETCVEDEESMCLNEERFQVRSRWTDFEGNTGTGKVSELSAETGYFWFFDPANVEVMVKVLDGREFNDTYWVFYGALSNVEFEIEVTDTMTGRQVIYSNPLENFGSRADTSAFPEPSP